jgi:Domain of unknown function (DUF4136)
MTKLPLFNLLSKTVALASVLLLNACVSSPEIRVNVDKNADFSSYHTYGFVEPLGTDKAGYTTLVTKYLREAVSKELEKRGYVFSNDPELLVNFYARLENRTFISSAPTPVFYGGYYDYRYGIYAAYPRYIYHPISYNYKEGTVNVDLVDAQKKQMVWEGVAVNEVDSQDLDNPRQAFSKVIAAIFMSYPFRAGSAKAITDKK